MIQNSYSKLYGTRAERLALTTPGILDEFYETDYAAVWQWTGSAWRLIKVLWTGQNRNREKNAVGATRVSFTWPEPVHEITFVVQREVAAVVSATAAALTASIAVAFDAPNDLVADTWLTSTNSGTVDSQRVIVQEDRRTTFQFTNGITRLDFLRYTGAEALTVSVEAV